MGIEILSILGTASGLITSLVQRFTDHKKMLLDLDILKAKQEHELKMREVDAKLLKEEYVARGNLMILEHEAKLDASDAQVRIATIQEESNRFSANLAPDTFTARIWVSLDAIRALVRPMLTGIITSAFTTVSVIAILNVIKEGGLNNYAIAEKSLGILGYSMNAVITHYFNTRNKASEANARKR